MSKDPFDFLERLVGRWQGKMRTWFEPGSAALHDEVAGTIAPALGGRTLLHRYRCKVGGKPARGLAAIGRDIATGMAGVAWVDSFHTGGDVMFFTADGRSVKHGFSVLGSYAAPSGPAWGWRTSYRLKSPGSLEILHHNIVPGGQEALAVEILYRRAGSTRAASAR